MAYNDEPIPPNRSNFRVILGVLMVAFSIYRLFMLIRILPVLFERGDTTELLAYGLLPAFIVVTFFFFGMRIARQGYYGPDKPKREE
jgi:hypothetical protein